MQDKTCQKCTEGEIKNEQHVVLECQAYRIGGREMGSLRGAGGAGAKKKYSN